MINTEISGAVAHVAFDDGGLNILNKASVHKMLQTFQFLESNQDVRTIVLEGNGRSLSAGLDLSVMREGGEARDQLLEDTGQLLRGLYSSRLRLVSICAGHAAAAGAMLLLVSDYRVGVSKSGKIGFPEVANGLGLPRFAVDLAIDRLNRTDLFAATALARMYDHDSARVAGYLDVAMSNYRDARYHALEQAEQLAKLDDAAYLETLQHLRRHTLGKEFA